MARFGRFFLPGPTEVRPAISRTMTRAMIGHRDPEFEELFARIQTGLRYVFQTTRPVFVSTSSATGLMEAGVRSALPGAMLALVNGAFSARFVRIAELTGRECDTYEVPAGEAHDAEELTRRLRARLYSAITLVHSETSTGVLNDVGALTAAAHAEGVVCIVDSVSGIGGAPFHFDAWGIDYALTGSQKALALPPGLAMAAATPAFVAGARTAPDRGLYFDLIEFEELSARNQTPNTPAIPLLFALDAQLAAIRAEGIEARWARHEAMLACVESWAIGVRDRRELEVSIAAAPGRRSPTVSALRLPPGLSGSDVVSAVRRRGYVIGTGYREFTGGSVRIGHMGDHTVKGVDACLEACEAALVELTGE